MPKPSGKTVCFLYGVKNHLVPRYGWMGWRTLSRQMGHPDALQQYVGGHPAENWKNPF